jgi:hypothetical protein
MSLRYGMSVDCRPDFRRSIFLEAGQTILFGLVVQSLFSDAKNSCGLFPLPPVKARTFTMCSFPTSSRDLTLVGTSSAVSKRSGVMTELSADMIVLPIASFQLSHISWPASRGNSMHCPEKRLIFLPYSLCHTLSPFWQRGYGNSVNSGVYDFLYQRLLGITPVGDIIAIRSKHSSPERLLSGLEQVKRTTRWGFSFSTFSW